MNKFVCITVCLLLALNVCHSQTQTSNRSTGGFLNSSSYREYLGKYENKSEVLFSDKRFFNLIGEEAFLYDSHYSSYLIYLSGSTDKDVTFYILKSKDRVSTATVKQIKQTDHLFYAKKNESYNKLSFKISSSSKIIDDNEAVKFNGMLSSYKKQIKERLPESSDSSVKFLYYFDGNKYYRISNFQIEPKAMIELDNLFKKSQLFQM